MEGGCFSSPAAELSQEGTVTMRYLTTLLSSSGDMGPRPQALRHHESDLISLEFVPLHLASVLALLFPKRQLSDRRGSLAPIWKMFHILQATFREERASLLALHPISAGTALDGS